MKYQATFGIDGGVSPGFGVKYPDYIRRTEEISAENSKDAYQNAMTMAKEFAYDHLSNPETDFTTVQLLSLSGPDGAVSFDASKAVVKRSTLEDLFSFRPEST